MLFKSRHIGKLMLFYALHNTTTKNCFNRILYFLKKQFSLGNCSSRNQMCLFYGQVIIAKQWHWQQQQHQLQMQKRSYSAYMSCQSSSSALSLTLQPTKKSSLGSLEKNAGATLADDFRLLLSFCFLHNGIVFKKRKSVSFKTLCSVQCR